MKRIIIVSLIAMLMISCVSPTAIADVIPIDPFIEFKGRLLLDGNPAGHGEVIMITNLNEERLFELVTNHEGYYSGDVGQGAEINDILRVSPNVPDTDDYESYVMITQFVILREEIQFDIGLQLNANIYGDEDFLNVGNHVVHAGKWDTHQCWYDDSEDPAPFNVLQSTDLTFKFTWQEHINNAVDYGPLSNRYILVGEEGDDWEPPLQYEAQGIYRFDVYQLRYESETRADDPFISFTYLNCDDDDDMASNLIFEDHGSAHQDPQVDYYYNLVYLPQQGSNWYDTWEDENEIEHNKWKIECIIMWREDLYCIGPGAPPVAIWNSPHGGGGWNEWSVQMELIMHN